MNSAVDVWKKVQAIISEELTATAVATWFDDCEAIQISDNKLYLHSSSNFKRDVIETRFADIINKALSELFSGSFTFLMLSDEELSVMTTNNDDSIGSTLDEYTFKQFVVGSSNKFAHAAALAVADGSQKHEYNPLFIYGESGVGKTHLLHAIRHQIGTNFPHYNIVYVKGEGFTNDLIHAIQVGKNIEFREKYRGADFLLIDDIQFIAGKIGIQEEIFNTFNTLFELGRQIVFTSDRPPAEIHKLENRLRTRFESGLIADIQPPDDALRVAIIKNKAESLGVILHEDITELIATSITSSVRQLEGAVKMIVAYRDLMGEEDITIDTVKKRLTDMAKNPKDKIPLQDIIIEETARFYSLTSEDIKGQDRTRDTALARQISMYLIRKYTNLSLKEVGAIFAGKDHTTVMSSIKKIDKLLKESPDFEKTINDITSNIKSKS